MNHGNTPTLLFTKKDFLAFKTLTSPDVRIQGIARLLCLGGSKFTQGCRHRTFFLDKNIFLYLLGGWGEGVERQINIEFRFEFSKIFNGQEVCISVILLICSFFPLTFFLSCLGKLFMTVISITVISNATNSFQNVSVCLFSTFQAMLLGLKDVQAFQTYCQ